MNVKDANKLIAFVGGYAGTSYELVIDFESKKVEYKVFEYGYTPAEKHSINLAGEDLEQFLKGLGEVKLFQWKESYADPGVLDGTNWLVKVYFQSDVFESSGTNAYPKKWRRFCEVIEKLTGQTFR